MVKTWVLSSILLMYCVFSSQTACAQATQYGPKKFDVNNRWTAIVAAYQPEIQAINRAFDTLDYALISDLVTIKGVKYQLGTYKDEPVIIFTTGISVPNAAMTMQMALDYFPIDKVVMMGIAGAINPAFKPGDIAVPERWYFHDESVYVNADDNGDPVLPKYYEQALKGYQARTHRDPNSPAYSSFGYLHPEEMSVIKQGWSSPKQMPYFTATPHLVELARKAVATNASIAMPSGKPIKIDVGGNGVTGSVFVDNAEYRDWLRHVYDAQVTEMESAAVGQVCFVNDVDWLIIRSVSDLAGAQKGQNAESVFDAIASGTGTRFMLRVLDQIVLAEQITEVAE